jgi:F-type H+-transporting ATPase subunit gamma
MPSIKDLKKSIGSVKNTQQTTRAMKVVSAAKLRRAQEAIQNQRPYAKGISELIKVLLGVVGTLEEHPLMRSFKPTETQAQKRVLLVVVTSDRGLCAGFNSNVIKGAQRFMAAEANRGISFELAFVGRKGYDFFKNRSVKLLQCRLFA